MVRLFLEANVPRNERWFSLSKGHKWTVVRAVHDTRLGYREVFGSGEHRQSWRIRKKMALAHDYHLFSTVLR